MISIKALRDKTALRATAPSIFLVLNSFAWWILASAIFNSTVDELNLLQTEKLGLFITYYACIGVAAILGSKVFPRTRTRSLNLWLFMGAIATFLLVAVSSGGILVDTLIAIFFGTSIGIGFPSCLSYFADSTSVENRGFVGGIIWGAVGFTALVLALLMSMVGQLETIVALTIWRLFGGIVFWALSRNHEKPASQKSPSYFEVIRKREILLYLFPWIMFSVINFAEAPILERVSGAEFFTIVELVESALVGIVAIVGGIIADIAGRKRLVIAGFIMFGIEYAALSAFSSSPVTVYLFFALDGVTWGLFVSVFLTVIWGDLGEGYEKEKYYTLGGLPYLLANVLYILIKPYASVIPATAAFSFASFFLFLAVIPLMYAPETLPEKTVKDRELKSYIEKAKKQRARA